MRDGYPVTASSVQFLWDPTPEPWVLESRTVLVT